eukprot:COSAG01_NODE_5592_length_4159_cov_12.092365_2_plen_176_part_00
MGTVHHNLVLVLLLRGVHTTCGCSGAAEHGHNGGLCIVFTCSWRVANFGSPTLSRLQRVTIDMRMVACSRSTMVSRQSCHDLLHQQQCCERPSWQPPTHQSLVRHVRRCCVGANIRRREGPHQILQHGTWPAWDCTVSFCRPRRLCMMGLRIVSCTTCGAILVATGSCCGPIAAR